MRKLSDSESIGKKLATLPKYDGGFGGHKYLQPQYSLTLGKSDETLSRSDIGQGSSNQVTAAKSFNNITDSNLSDDEIARRNKMTMEQLQSQINQKLKTPSKALGSNRADNNNKNTNNNPMIRIQVEDTTTNTTTTTTTTNQKKERHPPLARKSKTRHQSLGDATAATTSQSETGGKRNRLPEQSRSLDSNNSGSRSRSRVHEEQLPPAPPPPNCSPRNSNGRSPLERLSKDELVLLWRSSESELRSHLLKAIRDKEEPSDPP